ncbi:uncharacterized protein LOC132550843 [Ylistrum balloti]|uniref:uncharacterized protein LOC132550843 n=1 Tax=Ylistrum balloti TaxID=509963 RepID=UPI0029059F4D|nr:uncharacterized protein LOC132550843 [Ylistrum balloti]
MESQQEQKEARFKDPSEDPPNHQTRKILLQHGETVNKTEDPTPQPDSTEHQTTHGSSVSQLEAETTHNSSASQNGAETTNNPLASQNGAETTNNALASQNGAETTNNPLASQNEAETTNNSSSSQNQDQQTSKQEKPKLPSRKNRKKQKAPSKTPEQRHTYHGLCDVIFHYLSNNESARRFLHSYLPSNVTVVKQKPDEEGEKCFADCNQSLKSTLDLPKGTIVQDLETLLFRAWFNYQEDSEKLAWMEVIPAERRAYQISNKLSSVSSVDSVVSGGAMISPTVFIKHWSVAGTVQVTFEHDNELLSVTRKRGFGTEEVMEIAYSILSDTMIAHHNRNAWHIYVGLKYPPKIIEKSKRPKSDQMEEKRMVHLTSVTRENIGFTSVLCLDVPDNKKEQPSPSTSTDQNSMWTLMARLKRHGFSISYANVSVKDPENRQVNKIKFDTFDLNYAWESLLACGFKVTDAITEQSLALLEQKKSVLIPEVFQEMTSSADNSQFFEFDRILTKSQERFDHLSVPDERKELPSHFSMTRRIVVTPTRMIPLRKEPIVQNRIIRKYDDDFFVRVIFRDEDFTRLSATRSEGFKNITNRLQEFMDHGFQIGDRKYEFLACSNSQLREHGVWFVCPNNGETAESIRFAAGDLTKETCVATYVSRMGLCFSASRATVEVDVDRGSVKFIDDVKLGSYCFTDGIGKISVPLAKKVAGSLKMDPVPSAFQIRYGGCKGVIAMDPTLGKTEQIHIRGSMRKFESPSKNLEILQTTHPGQLHLNRQVITLMSGLGVPDNVFMSLQEKMLFNIADMLLENKRALRALSEVNIGMKYMDLMRAGISFIDEAFFRSILMTIYKRKLAELIRKTRIEIDYDQGRSMMGTTDETGTLEYGQIFVSYTQHDGMNFRGITILDTEVVVAKNPCFHPGDLRKFKAVDVPGLHHHVDCIVFPQKGHRPHPDEMSGSDLDGDMYFVCWDKQMHPLGENKTAMDFQIPNKSKLPRPVQVSDVTHFISEYIRNDQLGVIANAHVVHADIKDIFCEECINLSRKHSDAVDFPKTGVVPEMTQDLRCEKYPDFMMKSDKPRYTSNKVLGKLFRQCRSLEHAHSRTYEIDLLQHATVIDPDMIYPGYETYLESAQLSYDMYNEKILQLMSLYGVETEAEIVTGIIQKLKKKRGYLQNEKYELGKVIQGKMSVIRQNVRADFFEEFGEEMLYPSNSEDNKRKILAKASAWYIVAYDVKFQKVSTGKRLVSFPWIISEILSEMKSDAESSTRDEIKDIKLDQERPVLAQIGSSILRHFDMRHEDRDETFRFLHECFGMLHGHLYHNVNKEIKLSITGMQSLCLMDIYTSEIDVCLDFPQRLSKEDFTRRVKYGMRSYQNVSPVSYVIPTNDDPVTVTFSQNTIDKNRTDFIRQELQKRPYYTLILTFLLDWGRKFGLVGRNRHALFNEIVFVMLVLKLLSDADSNPTAAPVDLNKSWFPGKISSNDQANTASLLLTVLRTFNSLLNEDKNGMFKISLPDPTDTNSRRLLFPGKIDWRKYKHLTEEILFVYQEIAKNRSVSAFFDQNIIEEDHLMINLPLDIWGSVMFAETYTARRLSADTGAEISIRRKTYRDTPGLILEAWGTREQLWDVQHSLQNLNDKSSKFITTAARDKAFIGGAFKRLFYGSTGPDQQLTFERYQGRCQPAHKEIPLYIASVDSSNQDNGKSLEMFKEVFRTQIELIRQDFESTYHGELRIAITFGIYYIFYVDNPQFTISELEMEMNGNTYRKEEKLELNPSGRGRWRNRKRHSRFTKPRPRHIRTSFMPLECDKNNVSAFLLNKFFREQHEEVKFHATFKMGNQDYGKRHEGQVVLDKDLRFIELRLSDLKWMAVDVCRGYADMSNTRKRLDVRCKLQSRRLMDLEGVREMTDTKMLLDPDNTVLLQPKPNILYVCQEFKDRVPFVREKHVRTYHYDGPVTDYNIWKDMSIEIARVLEYSIPDASGRFQDMVEKQEVTVIPKLPSLETEDTEWEQYAEDVWELIEHLGEQFDSDIS